MKTKWSQSEKATLRGAYIALVGAIAAAVIAAVVALYVAGVFSGPAHSGSQGTPSASASVRPSPTASQPGRITDSAAGLSYASLPAPWEGNCPSVMSKAFPWTAGEAALAGKVYGGWFGLACSGPLPQKYRYAGKADLESTTVNLVNAFQKPFYGPLMGQRTQLASMPVSISGNAGWEVKFLENYPDATSQGLAWTSETAAIVVVDVGVGKTPAVFYVSVPSNLKTTDVDFLVKSLQLAVSSGRQ